jgi:hypothetical protein
MVAHQTEEAMGRIITPTHRVEYRSNLLAMGIVRADGCSRVDGKPVHMQAWRGRATQARLADWRIQMNKSFQAGGANEHVSKAFNAVDHISFARIVRQADDAVMAEVAMPTFEVV